MPKGVYIRKPRSEDHKRKLGLAHLNKKIRHSSVIEIQTHLWLELDGVK